jgi:glycosyltransferase involved in cell wall biosynthesis
VTDQAEPGRLPPVLIVTPGGLEDGGGIGRVIGYMIDGWRLLAAPPRWLVLDTRGPRVDLKAPFRFAYCLVAILLAVPRRPLLHIHVAGRGSTARKLVVMAWARLLGLRRILHLHDYNYGDFCDSLPRWAETPVRFMFRSADLVIVLGKGDATLVEQRFGVARARIAILHNAVTAPDPPIDRAAKGSGAAPHILFLGRLSERKGVPDLLRALAEPPLRRLAWQATLAGDGDVARYREQAMALGIADRVTFPGWLDRAGTDGKLRHADILVLPSYDEGMAMSVLEGLAYRLCVVCTPVGALAEVIEHEVSGLLVKPGDIAGLAAALAELVENAPHRRRLAEGGEALFRRGFDSARYAERALALYRSVLESS